MKASDIELKHLRNRFVSDTNLPIQVIQSPFFEERLKLCEEEYGAYTKYQDLVNLIDVNFDGNPNLFLQKYHEIRDNIISSVKDTKEFKNFLNDNSIIGNFKPIIGNRNLYTQEQDKCLFISFDMKKANFQALKYINPNIVFNAKSYEDFIGIFTDLEYIKMSKYTRQVIFGNMNPKRIMTVEHKLTNQLALEVLEKYKEEKIELFSLNSDEIIFKFNGNEDEFENFPNIGDYNFNGVVYRFNKFKLHHRQFELATSSALLNVYEKEDYLNGHRRQLHGVPSTYFPQVYKLLKGLVISEHDLIFYYEHELCRFMNQLKLIK